jgi:AcrR family transcriptional regulator
MSRRPEQRRLGRPPASDSSVTRERILRTARVTFSQLGYGATTNKHLAERAGVTTGALYHYFESKLDIYAAVLGEVQTFVYEHFGAVLQQTDTFIGALEATLDEAHAMNNADPSLAQFLGAARIDVGRYPELDSIYGPSLQVRQGFVDDLIEIGLRTGEIEEGDRRRVAALIRTMMIGLVDAVSDDRRLHREAIEGIKLLLEGKLIRPVP